MSFLLLRQGEGRESSPSKNITPGKISQRLSLSLRDLSGSLASPPHPDLLPPRLPLEASGCGLLPNLCCFRLVPTRWGWGPSAPISQVKLRPGQGWLQGVGSVLSADGPLACPGVPRVSLPCWALDLGWRGSGLGLHSLAAASPFEPLFPWLQGE